ncbi:hypothetical protein NDK43_08490 [Neobacillus pocheonensis]|uniref:Uncharacterized protein n=1 Tax=Neobacillus pocheonensis TaxID=363869 RepID=A0ABT0W7X1_9BACI|nr:hypothetical protein [Neobacillus pocheonensis]
MMKRMFISYSISAALLFDLIGSGPAFAATQENSQMEPQAAIHGNAQKGHVWNNPEFMKKQAEMLGIQTKGKDNQTIAKEVREAMFKKKAEALGIDTKGKDAAGR